MSLYPMNLNLTQKRCAVVGGGKVAFRKACALWDAGARVTVISPALCGPLGDMAKRREIYHRDKCYEKGDLAGFFLVICAADRADVNRRAAEEAARGGALVNVTDGSHPGNFTVPAQVCRGDLLFTVSTGGKSPAFARQLQRELAGRYGEEYAVCLDLLAGMRAEVKQKLPESGMRVAFWQKAMNQGILDLIKQGKLEKAEAGIRDAISSIRAES